MDPRLWFSQSCSFGLFLLMLVFVQQWLSCHWEILIMLLSQYPLTFHHIHNGMPHFIALLMTLLMLIGAVFLIIWEMFHGRISLNSVPLLQQNSLAAEFWEWVQVGTDVYIPHWKYQVKYHSSPWFSAACTAAIVHRNHLFCFYQKGKSYESQHSNFSSKAIGKIIAEAEKIIYLGSAN